MVDYVRGRFFGDIGKPFASTRIKYRSTWQTVFIKRSYFLGGCASMEVGFGSLAGATFFMIFLSTAGTTLLAIIFVFLLDVTDSHFVSDFEVFNGFIQSELHGLHVTLCDTFYHNRCIG